MLWVNRYYRAGMIPRIPARDDTPAWQRLLARSITDPAELLRRLRLDPALLPAARAAAARFRLRVTLPWLARIRPGDPHDPLLRQVLPLGEELAPQPPGFGPDPVGDLAAGRAPGLLHKYHGRALLITTGACAIHCRYCFRRHYPYGEHNASAALEDSLAYLRRRPDIKEFILSGGDPLMLGDARLAALLDALEALPHLRRLRLHSRLPVVLPQRITPTLVDRLAASRLAAVLVIHANHPREIDDSVTEALQALNRAGVRLFNQSVLLRGVNDDVDSLAELSERLFDSGVQPYYLHLLDPVAGAAHFEVPEAKARALHAALAARLPGYLLPRLAREQAGAPAKTLLGA